VGDPKKQAKNYERQYIEELFTAAYQQSLEYIPPSPASISLSEEDTRLIAFYLPQYHPIP